MELHNPFQQCLVGKVSEANVILRRYRPFWRNSDISIFRGKFVLRDGIAVLEGEYSMHKFTKIFTTIWLSGVTAFFLMFIIDAFTTSHKEDILFFLCITAAMLVFGVILLRIGWVLGRGDIDYIESIIHKSIK